MSVYIDQFMRNYDELVKYKEQTGNSNPPRSYVSASGVRLGEWLHRCRLRARGTKGRPLTSEERELLTVLGVKMRYDSVSSKEIEINTELLRIAYEMSNELPDKSEPKKAFLDFISKNNKL